MAKKRSRPEFTLPSTDPKGKPASADWVYRSEDKAPAPAPPRRATSRAREDTALVKPAAVAVAAPARARASGHLEAANTIVGNYATLAAGAGLIPAPLLDVLAIGSLQLKMIAALAEHYSVPFNNETGKAMLSAAIGSVGSTRLAYGAGGSLLKAVPIVGPALSALAMPGFGAAFTYAVGAFFVRHFERGGTASR